MACTDLSALIARVEAATGPDRKLDAEIALIAGYANERRSSDRRPWWYAPNGDRVAYFWQQDHPPAYTASLDAAVSLVPSGWEVALYWGVKGFRPEAQLETEDTREVLISSTAATPALALCAAALRARQAMEGGDHG
jgi:hypothetical protein